MFKPCLSLSLLCIMLIVVFSKPSEAQPKCLSCFDNNSEYFFHFVAGGFIVLAVTSFMAAVKLHHLTERIANFRENVFQFVILEEQFEGCFWLCVASATAHAVNLLLIAISGIHFPKIKTKTEEANVTPEDIMY